MLKLSFMTLHLVFVVQISIKMKYGVTVVLNVEVAFVS